MLSPIEKLQKFFKLESERGYDNRAVVGGLDKILPSWQAEAAEKKLPEDIIRAVSNTLNRYRDMDETGRAQALTELLGQLSTVEISAAPIIPSIQPEKPRTSGKNAGASAPAERRAERVENRRTAEPAPGLGLNAPLTVIPGIGDRHGHTLRTIGLQTLSDLLHYFPRRYDDYSQLKPINRLQYGEEVTVLGAVHSATNRLTRGGALTITEVIISDGTAFLRLTWFNQPWLESKLKPGTQIVVSGKIEEYLGRPTMSNAEWEPLEQEHLHTNRIVPVYPLTAHITQRWLRRIMHQTVSYWAPRIPDPLPNWIQKESEVINLPTALLQAHFPDNEAQLQAARERLAFDEIFLLQLGVLRQKRNWEAVTAQTFTVSDEWLREQAQRLPYSLTGAQQTVLADIRQDLASGRPMNRLLQGDVGSGKTIVAALAIAMVAQSGAQATLMAPTSILAEQHYRSLLRTLSETISDDLPQAPLMPEQIALLIGDTSEAEKARIYAGLADGSIRVVIGTHALIEAPVTFQRLQLAVIDEQHRFGVAQRATLRNKGENPHLLVMTATPIPRSLALTLYGDLDLSVMDEMPAGRIPIETHVLHPLERERAYHVIKNEIGAGHQAFIIYPLVDGGEREEAKAAVQERDRLQQQVFPHLKIGLLHGRLKPDEKEAVMTEFRDGRYEILVSTSVVEVGVDVPNATVMLVEGANRFGLSQLHQFRGRVGRGQAQSFCLLIPENENDVENKRLAAMAETNDGFVLAERDLEQRGPGDFLGNRQSGYADLKMANLSDVRLIEKARKQAQRLFNQDPELSDPQHQLLLNALNSFWESGRGDIS